MIGSITLSEKNLSPAFSGNRYHGGAAETVGSHPYVKGYYYIYFGFPTHIFDGKSIAAGTAQEILMTSAEGFTPPGDRTLMAGDIQGQGGVDASFITGQQITREFGIQFKDYWGAPIFRIHRNWTNYINPYLGGSTVAQKFSSQEYKGVCMVIQTKPIAGGESSKRAWTADDIIKIDYFDGVIPLTDLKSAYDANITDNTFVKPTVQYKFDGFPLDETDPETRTKALKLLQNKEQFERTLNAYEKLRTAEVEDGSASSPKSFTGTK